MFLGIFKGRILGSAYHLGGGDPYLNNILFDILVTALLESFSSRINIMYQSAPYTAFIVWFFVVMMTTIFEFMYTLISQLNRLDQWEQVSC